MEQPLERVRLNATKCRDLAFSALTPEAREVLTDLAERYELEAVALERSVAGHRRPAFRWALD